MTQSYSCDVGVVGGGVAGIMLTKKLSELGLRVALFEKGSQLAGGASTRNEGWLHRGSYHAQSIPNRETAIQVARRCIYGHEQIRAYVPEAIEDLDLPTFALTMRQDRVHEIVERWDEAGVQYEPISTRSFAEMVPEVDPSSIAQVFRVGDVSLHTRLLYRKLVADSERAGAQFFVQADVHFLSDDPLVAQVSLASGDTITVNAGLYIHTAGYGTSALLKAQFNTLVPIRHWKSHLVLLPRLSQYGVFCLDPGEAAMMNHGDVSIVGLNEDAFLCDEPDFTPVSEKVDNVMTAVQRLFLAPRLDFSYSVACVKVDYLASPLDSTRSLNISVSEPLPGHLCMLPGKMTEAPYVTDVVTRLIYDRIDDTRIAQRPCDTLLIPRRNNT